MGGCSRSLTQFRASLDIGLPRRPLLLPVRALFSAVWYQDYRCPHEPPFTQDQINSLRPLSSLSLSLSRGARRQSQLPNGHSRHTTTAMSLFLRRRRHGKRVPTTLPWHSPTHTRSSHAGRGKRQPRGRHDVSPPSRLCPAEAGSVERAGERAMKERKKEKRKNEILTAVSLLSGVWKMARAGWENDMSGRRGIAIHVSWVGQVRYVVVWLRRAARTLGLSVRPVPRWKRA